MLNRRNFVEIEAKSLYYLTCVKEEYLREISKRVKAPFENSNGKSRSNVICLDDDFTLIEIHFEEL